MDDTGQVCFEYLVIISLLIVIATLAVMISTGFLTMSETTKGTGEIYSNKTLGMLEGLK